MRVSPEVHVDPPCPRLHRKERLLVSGTWALVKFHSVVLKLYFTSLTLAHDAETDCEIGIVCVQLQLIVGVLHVVLHEGSHDSQFRKWLVKVGLYIRCDCLFYELN